MSRTDNNTAIKILAMISRGDPYSKITEATGVPAATISDIKGRNTHALAIMQERMIEHEVSKSKKILDKAHTIIEKKLDKVAKADETREELLQQFVNKEIEWKEYQARVALIPDSSLTELNAVSREAFNQSRVEDGKPTSITSSPSETKEQLMALVDAIKNGDEVKLFKMVLNPTNDDVIEGETV